MSIERREGAAGVRWRVRLHSGGRVVADRTFTTKRAAEVWERQQKEALHGGGFVPPERTRTPVSEVASAFLLARSGQVAPHTLRTDRDNIAALPSMFAARPIGSVSEADILSLLTDLLGVRAHSTVSRLRTTLSALWTWAVREHWAPTNPVRGVRMPSGSVQAHDGAPLTLPVVVAIIDAQRDRSPHGSAHHRMVESHRTPLVRASRSSGCRSARPSVPCRQGASRTERRLRREGSEIGSRAAHRSARRSCSRDRPRVGIRQGADRLSGHECDRPATARPVLPPRGRVDDDLPRAHDSRSAPLRGEHVAPPGSADQPGCRLAGG